MSLLALGCIDELPVELPSELQRIVIDGLISNKAEKSYVMIGWSSAVNAYCVDYFGNQVKCIPTQQVGPFKIDGVVKVTEGDGSRVVEIPFQMTDKKEMIQVNLNFSGIPGLKYDLEVAIWYNGVRESYSASTQMLPTPQISDITYEVRKGDVGKSDQFVPLISFIDPPEENFYLFRLCSVDGDQVHCENSRVWSYSLIADTFLATTVHQLAIDDGASIAKYANFYPAPQLNSGAEVRMYSVDRTVYNFYKALIAQFNSDGGAYTPAPAMPVGNISGNGIGLFRAIEESSATVKFE